MERRLQRVEASPPVANQADFEHTYLNELWLADEAREYERDSSHIIKVDGWPFSYEEAITILIAWKVQPWAGKTKQKVSDNADISDPEPRPKLLRGTPFKPKSDEPVPDILVVRNL